MNKEVKERWLEALRSGKYKQGTGKLKCQTKGELQYCCLGVLQELLHPEEFNPNPQTWDSNSVFTLTNDSQKFHWPTKQVLEEAKLTEDQMIALANLNDRSSNFDKVIEYIEPF